MTPPTDPISTGEMQTYHGKLAFRVAADGAIHSCYTGFGLNWMANEDDASPDTAARVLKIAGWHEKEGKPEIAQQIRDRYAASISKNSSTDFGEIISDLLDIDELLPAAEFRKIYDRAYNRLLWAERIALSAPDKFPPGFAYGICTTRSELYKACSDARLVRRTQIIRIRERVIPRLERVQEVAKQPLSQPVAHYFMHTATRKADGTIATTAPQQGERNALQ